MLCRVIGVRKEVNSFLIGYIVERHELVEAGTEINGKIKPDTGYRCSIGKGECYFHPDDLEVIDATH